LSFRATEGFHLHSIFCDFGLGSFSLNGLIFCGFIFGTSYSNNGSFGKEFVGEVKKKIEVLIF